MSDETEAAETSMSESPETELLPAAAVHAHALAYSDVAEDDQTQLDDEQDHVPKLGRRHRKLLEWLQPDDEVWTDDDDASYARGTVKIFVGFMVVTIAAAAWVVVVWERHHHAVAPPVTGQSTQAPAPGPSDGNDFAAMAVSVTAISSTQHKFAGFGTAGTQDEANRIALSECRVLGNDDCLLVNAGVYHGCISVAIDPSTRSWASGSGPTVVAARADALHHKGASAPTATHCSDPPGSVTPAPAVTGT